MTSVWMSDLLLSLECARRKCSGLKIVLTDDLSTLFIIKRQKLSQAREKREVITTLLWKLLGIGNLQKILKTDVWPQCLAVWRHLKGPQGQYKMKSCQQIKIKNYMFVNRYLI